jgi:hypothetical protein
MRRAWCAQVWALTLCGLSSWSFADQVTPSDRVVHYVNIRAAAMTSSAIIGALHPGERLEFVAIAASWYEVRLDSGQPGFVSDPPPATRHHGAPVHQGDPADRCHTGADDRPRRVLREHAG